MKSKEELNIQLSGHLKVVRFKGTQKEVLYDDHNAIQIDAKFVIAQLLGGIPNYNLDVIQAYKTGTGVVGANTVTVSFPSAYQVQFSTLFDEASFDDTIDILNLINAPHGITFSSVNGLTIAKDATSRLAITWTLDVKLC